MESKGVALKSQPKKNMWKPEEDLVLKTYVEAHGEGKWEAVSRNSGKFIYNDMPLSMVVIVLVTSISFYVLQKKKRLLTFTTCMASIISC